MVQEPLPVKPSDVASPVTGAVLSSRQREDRRQAKPGEKKRTRPTPQPTATTSPPQTDDEGDRPEIDILA